MAKHYWMPGEICSHSLVHTLRLSQQSTVMKDRFSIRLDVKSRRKFLSQLLVSGESAFWQLKSAPSFSAWFWGPQEAVDLTRCKRKPLSTRAAVSQSCWAWPCLISELAWPLAGRANCGYQDRVGGVLYAPRVSKCQEFLKPKQLSNKNDKSHKMQLSHLSPTSRIGTMSQQNFLVEQLGAAPGLGHSRQQKTVLSLF